MVNTFDRVLTSTSFGQRLRQERTRLRLTQAQLAEIGEVRRTTQHIYESDVRAPDVRYLEKIKIAGIDVAFLLLGDAYVVRRSGAIDLTPAELSDIYRAVEEFAVDDRGQPLPLDGRVGLFLFLCTSIAERRPQQVNVADLRARLARFAA